MTMERVNELKKELENVKKGCKEINVQINNLNEKIEETRELINKISEDLNEYEKRNNTTNEITNEFILECKKDDEEREEKRKNEIYKKMNKTEKGFTRFLEKRKKQYCYNDFLFVNKKLIHYETLKREYKEKTKAKFIFSINEDLIKEYFNFNKHHI